VGVVTPVVFGVDDAAAAVLPEGIAIIAFAFDPCVVLEVLEVPPDMLLSVWLIEISWSSWFSDTICPTISVGSTGDVGSWFCNSVTSRFRNVSCKLVDEVAELLLLLDVLLVPLAPLALLPVVLGALAFPACSGALTFGVNP
jgi:hypothetical protein